jgi:hypothetical protein
MQPIRLKKPVVPFKQRNSESFKIMENSFMLSSLANPAAARPRAAGNALGMSFQQKIRMDEKVQPVGLLIPK